MAKPILKRFLPSVSPHHSSFLTSFADTQFRGELSAVAQNTHGRKILRFSTEIAVYLGNGAR